MRQDERDVYVIPPNFIEGGTLMGGMIRTRNAIETGVLGALTALPVLQLELSLTARIIILCLTTLPLVLVALIGIGGQSLSQFVFWDNAEMNLLKALVLYVEQGYSEGDRTIGEVYRLLSMTSEKELDSLFDGLPVRS